MANLSGQMISAGFPPEGKRVLAVRGGALGDFILTLPSLARMQSAGYRLSLLTRPAYGRLATDPLPEERVRPLPWASDARPWADR